MLLSPLERTPRDANARAKLDCEATKSNARWVMISLWYSSVMLSCRINGNLCDKSMAIWHSMFICGSEVYSGKVICCHKAKCAVELCTTYSYLLLKHYLSLSQVSWYIYTILKKNNWMRSSYSCKLQYMNRLIGLWFNFTLISKVLLITHPSLPWGQWGRHEFLYSSSPWRISPLSA